MFYSQFILAKKGPLGTIWIAAHLERKLRKNQVADTDIGVSVDSILFPEVPIALRLSSHLLLGVVRIYSRKVNYLFDDCSEALLKIKHAFRSTAVDLPPEESTAPYHSITLPETFDLDDFELPDSDIFQGNYVDHHVSTREQITLQDTMEGVVYSTTQFGLDERFGDGDTSGLDLDEELFLNKVTAPDHAGVMLASDAEPHASVQPTTPLQQDKIHEGINRNSEVMLAPGRVNQQLEGLAGSADFLEYAQAPCTPGLVEEPNLSKTQEVSVGDDHLELGEEPNLFNIQEASACDDRLESEDHITKIAAKENLANITSNSDLHCQNEVAMSWSFPNDMNPVTVLGCQEINRLKSWGDSPSTAGNPISAEPVKAISPAFEFPDRNFTVDGANGLQNLKNGVAGNNLRSTHSIDGAHADAIGPQGVRLDETISCPSFSPEALVLVDPFDNSSTGIENISEKSCLAGSSHPVPECISEVNQASPRPEVSINGENAGNMEKSCPPSNSVASNIESPGRQDLENPETQACQDPKDSKILNPMVHEKIAAADIHVLHPCKHLNELSTLNPGCDVSVAPYLPSGVTGLCLMETSGREEVPHAPGASTEVQGEGCHATDFVKLVLVENHTTEPASCKDIQADFSKLKDHIDNVISSDTQLENIDVSESSELPAPEKFLSVAEGLADLQDNLLIEYTPDKAHLVTGDGGYDGININSEKKRSFTESTLTMQSLNSVESMGVVQSKRTKESVPDDNDLLSSILVGRRSSVLKMKPTPPPPPEITCMKRPRSASRVCASKRKVLMDDTMVLHGEIIRQQLTSTEDIRRIRKKAPCTRPEIWMIQKEFLEDEIFSETVFTGMSTGLALLHGQKYDLSGMELLMEPIINKETEMGGINESIVVRNDVEVEPPENQQGEEHVLLSQDYDTQLQMEAINDVPEPQSLPHEHSREIAERAIDGASDLVADAVNPTIGLGAESASSTNPDLGDKNNMPASAIVTTALLDKEGDGDGSLQMETSDVLPDQKLVQSVAMEASEVYISIGEGVNAIKVAEENDDSAAVGGTELIARDEFLLEETEGCPSVEIGADMQTACYAHTDNADPSHAISPETDRSSNQVVVTIDQAMEEIRKNEQEVVNDDGVLAAELCYVGKNPTYYGSGEEPKVASSYAAELNVDMKSAFLNDGKHPGCQEADLQCTMDAEISAVDHIATEVHGDFDYTLDGHDTGFLNADDDDFVGEDEECMPSAEQTSFLENSGWSSRTRAVAKYLQSLFDKEAEHGRKIVPMDNLLVGKTRKEASRMFFEALVLKTRDYIHVEQGAPFDNINIKPRVKLMKSDF